MTNESIQNELSNPVNELSDVAEYFPEENMTSTTLNLFRPIHQKILQIQEYETIPVNTDPSLSPSGLNSEVSTPKSPLSLSDINFVASPSAIYVNNSSLPNISNIDDFFENIDKQIENNRLSPDQNRNNVLYIQAEISVATTKGAAIIEHETNNNIPACVEPIQKICSGVQVNEQGQNLHSDYINTKETITSIDIIKNKETPFFRDEIIQDIQVSNTETIAPTDQITTDDKENQPTVIQIEISDNNQYDLQVISDKTSGTNEPVNENDVDDIETITVDHNKQTSPLSSEIANLQSENSNSNDTWQIFSLEKPDSPVTATRKRKRNAASWKSNICKKLKNSGKAYVSLRSNKKRMEKSMGATCSCKKKCYEKISTPLRKKIFDQYWESGDHEKQWGWILRHVSANCIKKMQLERKSNRTQTLTYKLPIDDEMTTDAIVCKKMFIQILGIAEKVVYTAIEKKNSSLTDLRGKHENRPHKISEDTEKSVVEHINEFPAVDSHYTRQRSKKVYLSEDLNISKMYRFYKTWFANKDYNTVCQMASKYQYETIFNTRFNISFFKPKKDQCDKCSIYKNADEERKLQLKEEYDKHLEEKVEVRKVKNLEKCLTDSNVKTVACFDLEKVLYIPQAEAGAFYYKRKFAIYNFTVFDLMKKKGYCYVWNQQTAKRGAIEVGSCLWHYINMEKNKGQRELSLYSDACTGQNRNRFIFALYQYACITLNMNITHRFFVSGHSQSEGDMMHSCIERSKKNQTIYTPEQMYFLVDNAKVEGEKFDVKEMTREDFYDIKKLIPKKGMNWTEDNKGNKVYWSKIREVVVRAGQEDKIYFKYTLKESHSFIETSKVIGSRRKRNNTMSVQACRLELAYPGPIPIPAPLHKDLISLCKSGSIPDRYHGFYMGLIVQTPANNKGNDSDSDEDEEV